jgi:GDPmannose 4,6-dehydratase
MWRMLQQPTPEDFVIATGETHTVRELVELAFAHVGLPLAWEGEGVEERGLAPDGSVLVAIDPDYFRPTEVDLLQGDASKAKRVLGWQASTSFGELVRLMVDADLAEARTPH